MSSRKTNDATRQPKSMADARKMIAGLRAELAVVQSEMGELREEMQENEKVKERQLERVNSQLRSVQGQLNASHIQNAQDPVRADDFMLRVRWLCEAELRKRGLEPEPPQTYSGAAPGQCKAIECEQVSCDNGFFRHLWSLTRERMPQKFAFSSDEFST